MVLGRFGLLRRGFRAYRSEEVHVTGLANDSLRRRLRIGVVFVRRLTPLVDVFVFAELAFICAAVVVFGGRILLFGV